MQVNIHPTPELPQTISLAPELVTGWVVFTGAPSSGISTTLSELARRGFKIGTEPVRTYLESEVARGRSLDEIYSDLHGIQEIHCRENLNMYSSFDPEDLVFLDRGIPDCLGFGSVGGIFTGDLLQHCRRIGYKAIFHLERLPIDWDGIRHWDDARSERISKALCEVYEAFGYNVIHVPRFSEDRSESLARRVEFILERLHEINLPGRP